MWRLLRTNSRFRRLFIAEAVTNFGETAVYLSLAIWVKDLTGSNAAAGIVFLAITAPGLAAPLLGHIVDRARQRRLLMIRMYSVMALFFLALLAVRGSGQLWIIYVVTFAYGILSATPARPALLKDFLPSQDAAPARSLLFSASEGIRIVSPAAGAGIYVAFGGSALAILGSATFVAGSLLLASIKIEESEPEPADLEEPFRKSVVAGFHFVRRVPYLLRLSLVAVAFMAVVGLLETAIFAANQGLGEKAAFLGVITSFQGGGSVVGGLIAGNVVDKQGESRSTGFGYALMGAGLLLCLLHSVPLFLLGVAFFGFGMPLVLVALGTAYHLFTPSRMQGRANAALGAVTGAAQTASIAAGAALINEFGYRSMYLLMACVSLACAAIAALGRVSRPEVVKSVADDEETDDTTAAAGIGHTDAPAVLASFGEQHSIDQHSIDQDLVVPAGVATAPEISR